ncbi:MAG: FAD:protein FMN transferase, partial [Actinomycetota bacterium]|nr:FAD:protein FMN transferase [Actinomycetota bacterium]
MERRSWVRQLMGMPVSVLARGDDVMLRAPDLDAAVDALYAELSQVDEVFSTYRPDSAVSRLAAGELPAEDSPAEVQEVIALCREAQLRTGGAFSAWLPGRPFDPSGLVKGWAVERAFRHLAASTLDVLVNAGGDVVARASTAFNVGIEDPADRSRMVAVVPLLAG